MKIYLVTIRLPDGIGRYFDSIWVVKSHAEDRKEQLRCELERSGFKVWRTGSAFDFQWVVAITEAFANDGKLADEEASGASGRLAAPQGEK